VEKSPQIAPFPPLFCGFRFPLRPQKTGAFSSSENPAAMCAYPKSKCPSLLSGHRSLSGHARTITILTSISWKFSIVNIMEKYRPFFLCLQQKYAVSPHFSQSNNHKIAKSGAA